MTAAPSIVFAASLSLQVGSSREIADILAASFGSGGLVLTEWDVSDDFFRLGSGLAGELFQKFVNYRIPLALVVQDFSAYGERFAELAREHASHAAIRFVHSVDEAVAWLDTRSAA